MSENGQIRSENSVELVTEQPTSERVRILAVDDDSSLLDVTATFLERERDNFEVITETRADEALSELAESEAEIDAIVSDYDMPAMNGLEFLEEVRERDPEIPFILFTGKGSEEIASSAISAGVTDYLQKGTGSSQYSVLANRLLNVVEKYRARRELERSERKFSKLVENSSDFISIVSADGYFEYVSPSCEHIVGYTQEEMVGDSVFNYVHPDDRQEVMERFFESVEDPEMDPVVEFQLNTADEDKKEVIIESRGTNLLDDDVVAGFVVNTRDITDLKERERDLKERNEQLEDIKDLITHDVQNPLTVALSSIELYRETDDDTHIGTVEKALHRIETLIDQTNVLADQPGTIEGTDTVSLNEIVRSVWDVVETQEATLYVEDSRRIEADTDRLKQLFENLIRNAVRHGGESVTCATGTMGDGIYFEDDGRGIPEGDRELVFESGYTTGDDRMGLGLTIVERIATGHGWDISVTESPEGGARFEITGVTFQPTVYE
jgi:PAS domain S-box-containing protein